MAPNPSLAVLLDPTDRRLANVDAFLADRGLDRTGLAQLIAEKAGPARHTLLTSSPVHGLANSTSDLDFILVQDDELTGPRMATQLFVDENHLETISFSAAETDQALTDLTDLADRSPADVVQGHRSWNRAHELRLKYLERLVNGVDLAGELPYRGHIPALARVWKWSSLQTATEQVYFSRLAQRAGEARGQLGYALGALQYLMDATLSHHGDVYSNRKWYLLRWRRFLASPPADRSTGRLLDLIEDLAGQLSVALSGPDAAAAPELEPLLDAAFATVGEGTRPVLDLRPAEEAPRMKFLPGAEMLLGPTAVFLGSTPLPTGPVDLSGLPTDPEACADLLRAARSGALRFGPA